MEQALGGLGIGDQQATTNGPALPIIKTEAGLDESNNSNGEGSEEISPSPTTGDQQPANPWANVKCVFCQVILTASEDPKLLECLHAACSNCVSTKLNEQTGHTDDGSESGVVVCPICHVLCRGCNIIENHFLIESTPLPANEAEPNDSAKFNDLKCGSCPENAPATSWCVECAEYICDGCVQAHQRLKITKEHTIKPKEEGEQDSQLPQTGVQPKSLFCSVHRQERLSLFCETCDRLTCRDCQLSEHREHKYKFIDEIAAETRNMISGLLSEVSYKRVLLKSAMKVIDDRQNLIIQKKKQLVREITQMVVKLTNTINARGKQLVVRLNEVCDGKQKTLNEKKLALDQLSKLTDHCIEFVNNALSMGSDMALLFSKTNLTTHLQRIKSRRADIPNPEIPVRINLALDKVPDLIKVASTIGSIIVDGRMYPPNNYNTSNGPAPNVNNNNNSSSSSNGNNSNNNNAAMLPVPPPSSQSQPPSVRHYASPPQHPAPAAASQQAPSVPYHNRVSPLQGMAQMPNQLAARTLHRSNSNPQPPHHSQQGMNPVKAHPSATVHHLHQQQVTSSTHPYNNSGQQVEPNLRGLLSHHNYQQQQHSSSYGGQVIRATSPQAGVAGPSMPLYRIAGGQLPPPMPPAAGGSVSSQHRYITSHQQHNFSQPVHPSAQPPQQPLTQQQQQQQMASAMQNGRGHPTYSNVARQLVQRVQSPHSSNQQMGSAGIQWHIPQQPAGNNYPTQGIGANNHQKQVPPPPHLLPVDESFKITLKQPLVRQNSGGTPPSVPTDQKPPHPSYVTSSVPKTPSPHTQAKAADDAEKSLDKFCQESVNDLMMTIAKLDSNGIIVIPEKGTDSLVDSSTGPIPSTSVTPQPPASSTQGLDSQKDDPNEDWCAVCLDGGEPVLCCDNCPKVFHLKCHIPSLKAFPGESETWQCLLCTNMSSISESVTVGEKRNRQGLDPAEQTLMERILLELYCQYEPSLHFREVVSHDNLEYHEKIKHPMSFEIIRRKLSRESTERYNSMKEVISDIRLVFKNAYIFNSKESQVYNDAKSLEEFLDTLLEKWVPSLAYDDSPQTSQEEEGPPPKRLRRGLVE